MKEMYELVVTLIHSMAVISVIAYILSRSRFYADFLAGKITWRNRWLLVIVFGLMSVYGTLSGFAFLGAVANTRDLGPALAGLFGGPIAGVGAGLIGAVHRYSMGGLTGVSCAMATVVSGLVGGLVFLWRKGKFVGVTGAIIVAAANQIIHSGLTLALARPFDQAMEIVARFTLPMIIANAIGMAVFVSIAVNLVKQRSWEQEKHTIEGELNAARVIQMSMVPKMFPPFPERPEFELSAVLEPAKEVGGDFYDFFFVDRHRAGDRRLLPLRLLLQMALRPVLLVDRSRGRRFDRRRRLLRLLPGADRGEARPYQGPAVLTRTGGSTGVPAVLPRPQLDTGNTFRLCGGIIRNSAVSLQVTEST